MFVNYVKTSKLIFKTLSPLGSQTILIFPHQTSWQYSDGDPLTGASNADLCESVVVVECFLNNVTVCSAVVHFIHVVIRSCFNLYKSLALQANKRAQNPVKNTGSNFLQMSGSFLVV